VCHNKVKCVLWRSKHNQFIGGKKTTFFGLLTDHLQVYKMLAIGDSYIVIYR
jgi:hypothetical protein